MTTADTGPDTGPASAAPLSYDKAYEKGYRAAARSTDLDASEARFERRYGTWRQHHGQWSAWMDGYLDRAAGRPRWHARDCSHATVNGGDGDHERCPWALGGGF